MGRIRKELAFNCQK